MRVAQGDLPGALTAYQASLDIRERLAATDPGNAQWQRDLAVSYFKLYQIAQEAAHNDEALQHRLRCREVLRGMKAQRMHLDPPMAGAAGSTGGGAGLRACQRRPSAASAAGPGSGGHVVTGAAAMGVYAPSGGRAARE